VAHIVFGGRCKGEETQTNSTWDWEGAVQRVHLRDTKTFADDANYLLGELHGDLRAKDACSAPFDRIPPHPQHESDYELLKRERNHIRNWLTKTGTTSENTLTGIALSGGGIRSASFSLGVLQALARHDVLNYIDYISTVSGGGYIGAGLTWWLLRKTGSSDTYGVDASSFPYGIADPAHPAESPAFSLAFLRDNASYLVPGGGISYLSGVAVLLRAVLLNLLVWIPVAAALFVLMIALGPLVQTIFEHIATPDLMAGLKIGLDEQAAMFNLLIWIGLGAIALFVLACVDYAFLTRFTNYLDEKIGPQDRTAGHTFSDSYVYDRVIRWTVIAVIPVVIVVIAYLWGKELSISVGWERAKAERLLLTAVLTAAAAASCLFISWTIRRIWRVENLGFVYGTRRFFERLYGKILLVGLLLLAIGSIPLIVVIINNQAATSAFGAAGIMLGVASGVWGHLREVSEKLGRLGPGVVLPIGSILLFFGIALISYQLADYYWNQADGWAWMGMTAIFLIAVSSAFMTNINEISPHLFYRDRLMEAFLPDIERVKDGSPGSAKRAERFLLSQAWDADDPRGPYPIINTNLILVNSSTLKYRLRGGDNFALTPLYCGSNATGWICTAKFAGGTLTLPTAMAISGAAANPNTAVGGKGLTRNRFVSAVMTLLNLRLGFWVQHPRSSLVASRPNHIHPGLTFCIPWYGYQEGQKFLELSDGGHFENLGIYELVRRGCRLIIVCDGGQDIRASYSDFVSAIRRIEQDFGAEIDFQNGGPERMIGRPANDEYPKDAEYAAHGFLWATIKYHRHAARGGPAQGIIVYLKTTMVRELGIKAKGYKGAQPSFPDESTGDQFFNEEQFEAYREVGYRIADTMCEDKQLDLTGILQQLKRPAPAEQRIN
jgi:predicted acylesterase/phospholipase RssA